MSDRSADVVDRGQAPRFPIELILYCLAIGSLFPYYSQPIPEASDTVWALFMSTTTYIFGVGPWLIEHPVRFALILPALAHMVWTFTRLPRH